ncbi:sugar phosphate isomerase/epimerase family protein [Rhodothermus profundi]|uniref:Sugar phosphate isomerase/epimerase n=1 Tax=Rhodothermus profundi TaxID=633813 RepID=A0A1M6Q8I2_9BACT|nr:sugar phosphate isomerase/epimerase family protein [Rhodothermus profundi]SHK16511.1 Sugar phosphate isomerase/epimerase [Rhodothermus profundi]
MIPALLTDTVTLNLDRALYLTLLWGLEGVELRTIGRPSDRVPFVNEEKLRRRLLENELPAVAIVPGMFEGSVRDRRTWMNEIAAFDEVLSFCRRIDCSCVVVSAFAAEEEVAIEEAAQALRMAGDKAAAYQVRVAVLNEPESAFPTGKALAELLEAVDHPAVGAAWNPAAALKAGENPVAGGQALTGRIFLVRCSDWRIDPDRGVWEPAPFGEGAVQWYAQLQLLQAMGFTGPLSLEVHAEPRAKRGFHDALRLLKLLRQTRKSSTMTAGG